MARSATILGCEGLDLNRSERAFFRDADPWGFILFARNVESPDQLRRLTGDLRDAVGRAALITIDQEGGRVQRLRAPHFREWLPPLDQMDQTASEGRDRAIWLRYRLIAEELRSVGIDSNCAPSVDIAMDETHPFLKNRCFGRDVRTVAAAARACAEGLLSGGVVPIMKHMPGHGRATLDSHLHLPVVDTDPETLRQTDFAAFRQLSDLPVGMTAHIRFTRLDDRPATQSPRVISLIRDEIGFDGLLVTDDLSMEALAGTLGERAARAIAAGCDLALYCKGERVDAEAVVAGAGLMTPDAIARADAALACRRPMPEAIDTARLEAELQGLLQGRGHV